MSEPDLDQRCINVVRGLAMDAPQQANSGHPGTAMALAPLAHVLWSRVMRYDASAPHWVNRDRFVLSCGHASILLYSMLYLTGYGLELDDLRDFRQWGSSTPGHPELGHTAGVEVTTGPLGQGLTNAVGMALAEHHLRARFGPELFDHHTYVMASDGDLMEGISHEAASLAGHLGLDKLVVVYDDNHITIDGPTELTLTDDAAKRFESYGWNVHELGEVANDLDALEAALRSAAATDGKPTLLVLRSHIGWPSPNLTDTSTAHGAPFGDDEIAATKQQMGMPTDESFFVPEDVLAFYREAGRAGSGARRASEDLIATSRASHDDLDACLASTGMPGWEKELPAWTTDDGPIATRKASDRCLNAILERVPGLIGGGADLTDNTGVGITGSVAFSSLHPEGRQVHFGVREHAMGAVMNGIAAHGGLIPFGGTFFVFSDYMRGAVRLSALSGHKVIFSWTHDSVGLGEDGPTHQPIEHLASLRAMPDLRVIRPADANECAVAWKTAIDHDGPTALVLSRQSLPILEGTGAEGTLEKGAYLLRDAADPSVVLIGTGSEVSLCMSAAERLQTEGHEAAVVSMPCWELFEAQPLSYRQDVLPAGVPVISVEAASTFGWSRWADASIGIDRFGASAPGPTALAELGITVDHVLAEARRLLA